MSLTLDILDRLIGFDTTSAKSNLALIDYAEGFLIQCGFHVVRIGDPDLPKAGLFAQIGPAGPGVLLSAHTDVVPVAGQDWTFDPFKLTRNGDRLHGRGTTDMKGFVAAMLNIAHHAGKMRLKEPLKLVLSYDEEVGCVGIARMMDRLAPLVGAPRMAVVGEPTEMQVATGHKGKRAYHAICSGEAGHSAMAPQFVNALHVAADYMQALREIGQCLEQEGAQDGDYDVPHSTVHVGTLTGGQALNIVPDRADMALEFRYLPQDDPDFLERKILDAAARVAQVHGETGSIKVDRQSAYPGLNASAQSIAVTETLKLAGTKTTKVAFGTEAGFFEALGIPTVVCGPGSMAGQGHKADEYLMMSELQACEAMLDRLLHSLAEDA